MGFIIRKAHSWWTFVVFLRRLEWSWNSKQRLCRRLWKVRSYLCPLQLYALIYWQRRWACRRRVHLKFTTNVGISERLSTHNLLQRWRVWSDLVWRVEDQENFKVLHQVDKRVSAIGLQSVPAEQRSAGWHLIFASHRRRYRRIHELESRQASCGKHDEQLSNTWESSSKVQILEFQYWAQLRHYGCLSPDLQLARLYGRLGRAIRGANDYI